jgi:hypothetical protein
MIAFRPQLTNVLIIKLTAAWNVPANERPGSVGSGGSIAAQTARGPQGLRRIRIALIITQRDGASAALVGNRETLQDCPAEQRMMCLASGSQECPASRRRNSSNRDKPSGPTTTASPSIAKLSALIRSAAAAIAASRTVQPLALRLYSRTKEPSRWPILR